MGVARRGIEGGRFYGRGCDYVMEYNGLLNVVTQGDCLDVMTRIPDKSVDMILCDLPYGTTACKWDTIIPFEPLWVEYERIIKPNGAIVLTASQPFTSALIMSNPSLFRYEIIWKKTVASNFALAKKQPLKRHENVVLFYKKQPTYNPIMRDGEPYIDNRNDGERNNFVGEKSVVKRQPIVNKGERYPDTVVEYSNGNNKRLHPTQKPVALFEYLIKTYTNEGDVVLDNCIGSGTTAIAAINTNRQFIGIEREPAYVATANKRINDTRLTKLESEAT
jgi:site-specific DNA-methyltransferase (adenine-specific)